MNEQTQYTFEDWLHNKFWKEKGLTEQQAYAAIDVIKNFAKEKFPIFGGAIDKLFDKYGPKDEEDFLD